MVPWAAPSEAIWGPLKAGPGGMLLSMPAFPQFIPFLSNPPFHKVVKGATVARNGWLETNPETRSGVMKLEVTLTRT